MIYDAGLLMLLMLASIRYRLMSPVGTASVFDRAVTFAFDSRSLSPLIFAARSRYDARRHFR